MTRPALFAVRSLALAALGLFLSACLQITESSSSKRQVNVRLTRSSSDAAEVFPGRYVSVLDTAILTVKSASGDLLSSSRVKLGQQDEVVAFSVTVEAGTVRFDAEIKSNNGVLLFDGTQSVNIGPGNDTISIGVLARSPVLLVSLDYTTYIGSSGMAFSTLVHNRGTDSLKWEIEGDAACRDLGAFCTPTKGTLGKLESQELRFLPSDVVPPPSIVLTSPSGKVRIPLPAR